MMTGINRVTGALCASLLALVATTAQAAFIAVLPTDASTPALAESTAQAYQDDSTGTIWLKDANASGAIDFATATTYIGGLSISYDSTGDGSQDAVASNWELPSIAAMQGLYATNGTGTGDGINDADPAPFINIVDNWYWSNQSNNPGVTQRAFDFGAVSSGESNRNVGNNSRAWAVVPIPVPAAVWLFGSGLLGLIGIARRKRQA